MTNIKMKREAASSAQWIPTNKIEECERARQSGNIWFHVEVFKSFRILSAIRQTEAEESLLGEKDKNEQIPSMSTSMYSDIADWTILVPEKLRVDLIQRSESFQNKDGPFQKVERLRKMSIYHGMVLQDLAKRSTDVIGKDEKLGERRNDQRTVEDDQINTLRRFLPQLLASTAKNLILLDLGMTIAFPTIVIPVLHNSSDPDGLSFTTTQASWFGSIAFICQPLGSVLSGIVLEPLGRKRSMLIVNIPHIIGWILFYSASSLFALYIAIVIMGLGVGFMEAPIITYVGEISEPQFRGILTSYAGLFVTLGFVLIYTLGNITDWQQVAGLSSIVPIITIIAISQVPETPLWLLSRGRANDAEKALCWLRGWVKPQAISKELNEMKGYSDSSKLKNKKWNKKSEQLNTMTYVNEVNLDDETNTVKLTTAQDLANKTNTKSINNDLNSRNTDSNHSTERHEPVNNSHNDIPNWKMKLQDLVRPEMLKPLRLVTGFFFFLNLSGITAMRPYFVHIFKELDFPVDPYKATVIMSVTQFGATVLCMVSVQSLGKRPIALVSILGCATSTIVIAVNEFVQMRLNDSEDTEHCWIPFIMFLVLTFFTGYGVGPIPWMLVSEVFPFRGRSLASGVAAAASYVLGFLATKTYLNLESHFTIAGAFTIYGCINIMGFLFLYFYLPETEGRSLQQIEESYQKKKSLKKMSTCVS